MLDSEPMKTPRSLLSFLCLLCSFIPSLKGAELQPYFARLNEAIGQREYFERIKRSRMDSLRQQLHSPGISGEEEYRLTQELFNGYKTYHCDSALYYIDRGMELADRYGNRTWHDEMSLNYSFILSAAGLHKESLDNMDKICRNTLSPHLLTEYYARYAQAYIDLNNYAHDNRFSPYYYHMANVYKDSLLNTLDMHTTGALMYMSRLWYSRQEFEQYQPLFEQGIRKIASGTHEHAAISFQMSEMYGSLGDSIRRTQSLIESAISDIQAAVKDNYSLRLLALDSYAAGNIPVAYEYIKYSLDDANFFDARQRTIEISRILPLIENSYQIESQKQKDNLKRYSILVSVLLFFLLLSTLFIYKQMQRVSRARDEVQAINTKLNRLNNQLAESNHVKEEYIGQFLSMCSSYIDKLMSYQKMVGRKIQAGQIDDLIKNIKSDAFIDEEQQKLLTNFDAIFLRIYPDFVEQFNKLLHENERYVLKKEELLNTELRIFALIRLGISDSSQIARFLRYSVNSIYTYRTKVKNKAIVPRDNFENEVMKIGEIKQ